MAGLSSSVRSARRRRRDRRPAPAAVRSRGASRRGGSGPRARSVADLGPGRGDVRDRSRDGLADGTRDSFVSGSDTPAVSVLVVNYNAGPHLGHCLERLSEIAEEWPAPHAGLETVVVDNASTDGSLEAVRELGDQDPAPPAVRLIASARNLGFGAACNLAARETAGRYLLLLNPDAWIDATSLRRLVEALEADSRLGVAAPRLHYPDGSLQLGWAPPVGVVGEAIQKFRNRFEGRAWNQVLLPRLLRPLLGQGWFSAACLLVRRSAFEEVGGFDEGFFLYFEDADLGLRLARVDWRQRQVTGARAWHLRGVTTGRPGTRLLSPQIERFYRASQLRYYDLHRPRWERSYLRRRLRRKFRRVAEEQQRLALLRLLERA
ncbi:MAG: glycosyltransferase family 2 protein [Holophagales bacterium]|nr:glycosyltransferase family 2 protein [Holophagales bacterium]MYD20610.1 glycosyltransferase family 2 protein [Holophagales bacterium]MYI34260.1 glycosyltransferase family 2 protein [Holophagales bacterium]